LAKQVLKPYEISPNSDAYRWYEMGFFTQWYYDGTPQDNDSKRGRICSRVLCIDTPASLRKKMFEVLQTPTPIEFKDPFAMLTPLFDRIVELYDDCTWRIRDEIRLIEKVD
jgi:hypothetical protein